MVTKWTNALVLSVLLSASLASVSPALAESRAEKKGVSLEQKSQELEQKSQEEVAKGHTFRAGRDAKKAAKDASRGEKKLKKAGVEPAQTAPTKTQ